MRLLAAIGVCVAASALAGTPAVERVVDESAGLDAMVIVIEPGANRGFAVLDAPKRARGENILTHWDSKSHVLMINGGYFSPEFAPTGLCRINGEAVARSRPNKLSGFVAIDRRGSIRLLTRADDVAPYPTVLQSGPYVIDPGGKMGIRSRSGSAAARTLIGTTRDGKVLIMVTKPILLYDLAVAVKGKMPDVERLLNLDGGPSTALKTGSVEVLNRWPVRNYIVKTRAPDTSAGGGDR